MSPSYDNAHFFEPVRQILDRIFAYGLLGKKKDLAMLWGVWEDAVGAPIAAHARPMRIENGVLTVLVDTAVWHHQLQMLQQKVIAELNRRLGENTVRDLHFRVG